MWKYVLKRILWMVVIMLCVTVVIFTITYFTPGNPARVLMGNSASESEVEAKAAELGIDKPFFVQLANYFSSVYLHGDFGRSWATSSPVLDTIIERLPVTIIIGGLAMLLQVIIGVPLGVMAAINQGKWQDYFSISLSLLLVSLPDFWVALMAVIVFAVNLNWLPVSGMDSWKCFVIPIIATTTIAKAILRILTDPPAKFLGGEICLDGENLAEKTEDEMLKVRGDKIAMIFQDPMTALNPIMSVGDQIVEVLLLHNSYCKAEAIQKAKEMLELVGIPGERYVEYPHQFSGGMKQRVVIAMALACDPELVLADEPTTALDVTIQAQVLDLIRELKEKYNTAMILITHDLGVVAQTCDNVAVIYAGKIVEYGSLEALFDHPTHPYTLGLFGSLPDIEKDEPRLHPIAGMPPDPTNLPEGCAFHPRCPHATAACTQEEIPLAEIAPGHFCRCCMRTKEE